jgi:hypothetical protein
MGQNIVSRVHGTLRTVNEVAVSNMRPIDMRVDIAYVASIRDRAARAHELCMLRDINQTAH